MKSNVRLSFPLPPAQGPTPPHRLLQNQCAKMGSRIHWAVRTSPKIDQWIAVAYYGRVPIAVATRADMDIAMLALLGKLFEMEGEP